MKTLEEFKAYFDATMHPQLEAMQAERLRALPHIWRHIRWLLAAWALTFVVALARGMTLQQIYEDLLPVHVLIPFALVGVVLWRFFRFVIRVNPILQRCKDEVIVPMVRWLAPELTYDPKGSLDLELAKRSNLIPRYDSMKGEDYFRGRLGQTELEFCELKVTYETVKREGGERKVERHEVNGLFLVASANKAFMGETHIYPDYAEAIIGDSAARMLSTNHLKSGLHLIHLEDPAFENLFKVYCTDDVEAHYLLTPSLMARLTAYREKVGWDVHLSFQDSRLYAYFPPTEGKAFMLFDVGGFNNLADFDVMKRIYDELAMALGIVEELNLNTRIWGEPQPAQA